MSHINFRRIPKIRKPVPRKPNKIIRPDVIYNRNKEKIKLSDLLKGET